MRACWLGWQPALCGAELTHSPSACRQSPRLRGSQVGTSHFTQESYSTCSSSHYGRHPVLARAALHQNAQHQQKQQIAFSRRTYARQKHARQASAKASKKDAPPRPARKFTKQDLKRIKQLGPSISDVIVAVPETQFITQNEIDLKASDKALEELVKNVEKVSKELGKELPDPKVWGLLDHVVPKEVLGENHAPEPNWDRLPRMGYREFFYGLQQRNWTSRHYDASAELWDLKFFTHGRYTSFPGYRVQLTKADGSQWRVDLPFSGADTYLEDHLQSAVPGSALHEQALLGTSSGVGLQDQHPLSDPEYGYNQIFEQLFQMFEQQMPADAMQQYTEKWQLDPQKSGYNCPSRIGLSFHRGKAPKTVPFAGPPWLKRAIRSADLFAEEAPYIFICLAILSSLFVILYIGIFRAPQSEQPQDMQQAKEYAQSKAKSRKEGKTNVKLADVAGLDHILGRLQQVVTYLQNPGSAEFTALARPPKGILLEGDPGVGKTLVAKALAGEAGVPFFQMSGSEFTEAIVGVGAARVRDLFKRARAQKQPCIIFVDEIDSLGSKRASYGIQTNEEREQTLNQLLTEMDGFIPGSGVIFMAATNRADALDQALTRPGRFDWRVLIAKPNQSARADILRVHCRHRPLGEDVDLDQIAKDLPGLSGAELANVMNEASLEAVKRSGNAVNMTDVYTAIDRVLQGIRRPQLPSDSEARKCFAVHEIGKALVGTLLRDQTGRLEEIDRVSIVPRGRQWSTTTFRRGSDEQYTMSTRSRMMERLQVILAGRAAEEVALHIPTTYSEQDLNDASRLALKMVTNYGLSDLGITTYASPNEPQGSRRKSYEVSVDNINADVFRDQLEGGSYSPCDETITAIKCTAYSLVTEAYDKNLEILRRHSDALRQGTLELLKIDTMTGQGLRDIMAQNPPQERDHRQNGSSPNGPGVKGNGSSRTGEMETLSTPVIVGNHRSSDS